MSLAQLTEAWSSNRAVMGGWVTSASPRAVHAFAHSGYDYVGIDAQHGLLGTFEASTLVQPLIGTGTAGLVRVAANDAALIGHALDAGADGVIVPFVDDAAQAAAAVAACRFPPNGVRSYGPMRPDLGAGPAELEARACIFVMVETRQAVENVDEICRTPGITGVYVGPADLAVSMQMPPLAGLQDPPDPAILTVIERICRAAQESGVVPGIHAGSGVMAARYETTGFRLITCGQERALVYSGAARELAAARQAFS